MLQVIGQMCNKGPVNLCGPSSIVGTVNYRVLQLGWILWRGEGMHMECWWGNHLENR